MAWRLKSQDVGGAEKDTPGLQWLQIPEVEGGGFEWRYMYTENSGVSTNASCEATGPPCEEEEEEEEEEDRANELKVRVPRCYLLRIYMPALDRSLSFSELQVNQPLPIERRRYDRIIRCTGWKPDLSIFHSTARPEIGADPSLKMEKQNHHFKCKLYHIVIQVPPH